MKLKILFSVISLIFCLSVGAKETSSGVVITPVEQDADAAHGGVVYSLPQTAVRVRLVARAVVSSVGPFFKYSTRYLNLTDVVTANSVRWELVSAEVTTFGVADESKRYKVSASADMPTVVTSSAGVLLGFNIDQEAEETFVSSPAPSLAYSKFEDVQLSQSVLMRTSTAAMAEECAASICNFRSLRLDLLSGTKEAQLPDAGAYGRVLDELDKQERAHLQLFTGRRDTVYVVRYIEVMPDQTATNLVPVRFSETAGFLDALDLSGTPVYVDFEFGAVARLSEYAEGSKQRASNPVSGLRYTIPSNVTIKVLDRNTLLTKRCCACSQGGQEATVPASLLLTHKIMLDSATGVIRSIELK